MPVLYGTLVSSLCLSSCKNTVISAVIKVLLVDVPNLMHLVVSFSSSRVFSKISHPCFGAPRGQTCSLFQVLYSVICFRLMILNY